MVFGPHHYPGMEGALDFLLLRNEESPGFYRRLSEAIWERMPIDYIRNVTAGVRCLTQLGSKRDGLGGIETFRLELGRLAISPYI